MRRSPANKPSGTISTVMVHTGLSLDARHYYPFCRPFDGLDPNGADGGWWRLDDSPATAVTADAALGRPRYFTGVVHILLYRMTQAGDGRRPVLTALNAPL